MPLLHIVNWFDVKIWVAVKLFNFHTKLNYPATQIFTSNQFTIHKSGGKILDFYTTVWKFQNFLSLRFYVKSYTQFNTITFYLNTTSDIFLAFLVVKHRSNSLRLMPPSGKSSWKPKKPIRREELDVKLVWISQKWKCYNRKWKGFFVLT